MVLQIPLCGNRELGKSMDRRQLLAAEITRRTGIDETMIERLVRSFYAKIRQDALLDPIFETRIRDWEPHLQRMCEFWSSVALMSGRYHGSPMAKHLPLPVDASHFDRWLILFEETAREICPPKSVEHFVERARRIAESLELGIAGQHGIIVGRGERFRRLNGTAGRGEVERMAPLKMHPCGPELLGISRRLCRALRKSFARICKRPDAIVSEEIG
jgi:hemoglobin